MQSINIERLKRLSELTVKLNNGHANSAVPCFTQYNTETGTNLAYSLFHNNNVAVARSFFSKGTKFSAHAHEETEYAIVSSGVLKITTREKGGEKEHVLPKGGCLLIPPETEHSIYCLEEGWSLWVSIPPSPGFPGVNSEGD